ncbi:MAG TPA: Sb-PDE family phosphodiesterase [Bacteroidales bacterium]|nr:Sb-PDE family phosphodiesterase [Bacteroidales bacterium]HRZ21599.1 Sb-PDE family phosphodiesterase [Bacteroidales bacterium]
MRRYPLLLIFLCCLFHTNSVHSQQLIRKEIHLPDIMGYQTLKCDLHIHTVFSDGHVWPDVRIWEAFREGLDAVAITDHLEYQPHKKYVDTVSNNAYELMKSTAEELNILLIKGVEVTRKMPPGHLNALFIENADLADDPDYEKTLQGLADQGAFIFWNHPGWIAQAKDGIRWYDEHTRLVEKNLIHGIEVGNYGEWYPEALGWCMEKNLTLSCNSDIHEPSDIYREYAGVKHRLVTLVFARERTLESIREALLDHRTAGWFEDTLMGQEKWLNELFLQSVTLSKPFNEMDRERFYYLSNSSDVSYTLHIENEADKSLAPERIFMPANSTILLSVKGQKGSVVPVSYIVENCFIRGRENLKITWNL